MLEKNDNQINPEKRQMRNGRLFTNKSKRVKGGDIKVRSVNVEEVNFQSTDVETGLGGQIALNRVDENGNVFIDMIAFGQIGEFTLTGSILPVVDAGGIGQGSILGSAGRAYGLMRSYLFSTSSDARLKKDIEDIKYGIDTIKKIRPVSYKFKKGKDEKHLGFIAQEIQEHLPEIVDGSEEESYGVAYQEVIPVLVKAVQELSERVELLEKKML